MNYKEEINKINKKMLELNDKATYTKGVDQEFYDEIEEELESLVNKREQLRLLRSKGL